MNLIELLSIYGSVCMEHGVDAARQRIIEIVGDIDLVNEIEICFNTDGQAVDSMGDRIRMIITPWSDTDVYEASMN